MFKSSCIDNHGQKSIELYFRVGKEAVSNKRPFSCLSIAVIDSNNLGTECSTTNTCNRAISQPESNFFKKNRAGEQIVELDCRIMYIFQSQHDDLW